MITFWNAILNGKYEALVVYIFSELIFEFYLEVEVYLKCEFVITDKKGGKRQIFTYKLYWPLCFFQWQQYSLPALQKGP